MLDFETIQTALKSLIATLLGMNAAMVMFDNEPRVSGTGHAARAVCSWVSGVGVGQDEERQEDNAAAIPEANLDVTTVGNRVLVLQVGIETLDQRPQAPHAFALAEQLRTRLRRASAGAALEAANLGLAGVGAVTRADYKSANGQWIARALVELRLNATALDTDDAVPSIETATGTATFTDPAGDELAAIAFTAEVQP